MVILKQTSSSLIKLCFFSLIIGLLPFGLKAGGPNDDGGMYPVSLLAKANLKAKGLNIPAKKIYNPGGKGLINAIVRIGGCTGSFVSDKGLVLTNHHCVFSKLEAKSTKQHNYVENGFNARQTGREIPFYNLNLKIMKGYKDVSDQVLDGIDTISDPVKKQKQLSVNQQKVKQQYQEKHPELEVEVSEMLAGDSYILFKYKMLKDLRLIYAPPRTVGEFGGSSDNWEWPRHTGDFAFLRAYVGKDGKPAEYSEDNVPFEPEVHLDINEEGVNINDFVSILGYPGRTYRHRSSAFIRFHKKVQLPYIGNLFEWKVRQLRDLQEGHERIETQYESKIKTLANVAKNYRGKLEAMDAIHLERKRKDEENEVFRKLGRINRDKQEKFLTVTDQIDSLYNEVMKKGKKIFWYYQLFNSSEAIKLARKTGKLISRINKNPDSAMVDKKSFIKDYRNKFEKIDHFTDSLFLRKFIKQGLEFEKGNALDPLKNYFKDKSVKTFIKKGYEEGHLLDTARIFKIVRNDPANLNDLKLPIVALWQRLKNDFSQTQRFRSKNFSKIGSLKPHYLNLKRKATQGLFVPDANGTLRFTSGKVKGYEPKDAVLYKPFTSLEGYQDKAKPSGDYRPFSRMMNVIKKEKNRQSDFQRKKTNDVPICFLYNTHTTGGNSGSPVLDANGDLVGLNFDRTYQGTITDYAWSDQYARSIGVDIRFILWYLSNVGEADHLINEMKVNQADQ